MYKVKERLPTGAHVFLDVYPSLNTVIIKAPDFGESVTLKREDYAEGKKAFLESLGEDKNDNISTGTRSTPINSGNKRRGRKRKTSVDSGEGKTGGLYDSARGEDLTEISE